MHLQSSRSAPQIELSSICYQRRAGSGNGLPIRPATSIPMPHMVVVLSRPSAHKPVACRAEVDVRFASKAARSLRSGEMTQRANTG
jgi:hypothetical protein